jgi:hypothetical protein
MRFGLGIGIGAVAALAILEALFRVLPVDTGIRMANVDRSMPFRHYLPRQRYVYSFGWALVDVRRGTTNDQGFANSADFTGAGGVLIVGDSFIEGLRLDYRETVQGRLDSALGGNVHAAASGGNRLADSLELVRTYAPILHPRAIVIFVTSVEVSTLMEPPADGGNGFVVSGDHVSVAHSEYRESPLKPIVLASALARYVYLNLRFPNWLATVVHLGRASDRRTPPPDVGEKEKILSFYFSEIRALAEADHFRVLFLVDGDRDAIYGFKGGRTPPWNDDRDFFLRIARRYDAEIVDMDPIFARHWAERHEKMDFLPLDGHWNSVAHGLAAQELSKRLAR